MQDISIGVSCPADVGQQACFPRISSLFPLHFKLGADALQWLFQPVPTREQFLPSLIRESNADKKPL